MYGLGIRIGFYMQCYGTILASWLAPPEVPNLRLTNRFFITATSIALAIQRDSLLPSQIYINLAALLWIDTVLVTCQSMTAATRLGFRWRNL
jgi:hypothetical protein